ncbi:MAG: SAM-dependent chlorinase/fluorinase, partial [Rhodospirillales bacterium]|nr:SAM-dependent chlorinase/fluorinase [Rhodospirillales bacterium]
MIVLFTDFGLDGPYVGQMKAVLHAEAPGVPLIDLMADAPAFDARAAAYLLAAYAPAFPAGCVFLAVVDPGVGGPRLPLAVEADARWFVGPDNGLLAPTARRAEAARTWQVTWRPDRLSASFHGRDLFAPVAARLALGEEPPGSPYPVA